MEQEQMQIEEIEELEVQENDYMPQDEYIAYVSAIATKYGNRYLTELQQAEQLPTVEQLLALPKERRIEVAEEWADEITHTAHSKRIYLGNIIVEVYQNGQVSTRYVSEGRLFPRDFTEDGEEVEGSQKPHLPKRGSFDEFLHPYRAPADPPSWYRAEKAFAKLEAERLAAEAQALRGSNTKQIWTPYKREFELVKEVLQEGGMKFTSQPVVRTATPGHVYPTGKSVRMLRKSINLNTLKETVGEWYPHPIMGCTIEYPSRQGRGLTIPIHSPSFVIT